MRNCIAILTLYFPILIGICLSFSTRCQSLVLKDRFEGNFGLLNDLVIDQNGNRYYAFDRAKDSAFINSTFLDLQPHHPDIGSPYYFGYPLLIVVNNELKEFYHNSFGGNDLLINNEKVFSVRTVLEDTTYVGDTILLNHAAYPGENLIIANIDSQGSLTIFLSDTVSHAHGINASGIEIHNGSIYLTGTFGLVDNDTTGLVILGDSLGLGSSSWSKNFITKINSKNGSQTDWITGFGERGDFFNSEIAILDTSHIYLSAYTNSSKFKACDDTIRNPTIQPLRSTYFYITRIANDGSCNSFITADIDRGEAIIHDIQTINDNKLIALGSFTSSKIQFDTFEQVNSFGISQDFVVVYDKNLNARNLLNAKCNGPYYVKGIEIFEGDIWVNLIFDFDSIDISGYSITGQSNQRNCVLIRLSEDLNLINYIEYEEDTPLQLFAGSDDHLYTWTRHDVDLYRLYRVDSLLNNRNPKLTTKKSPYVFPNPTTGLVRITSKHDLSGCTYSLFNSAGKIIRSSVLNNEKSISLADVSPGLYFIRITKNDHLSIQPIIKL